MAKDPGSFDEKIERSSLGEESALKLRRRTPMEVTESIAKRVREPKVRRPSRGSGGHSP